MNHQLKDLEDSVSRETISKLEHYHSLLLKWQKTINIVSPNTIPDAWNRHILDSLQVVNLLDDNVKVLMDLGCGGGFPGMAVAICRPDIDVYLVESDQRKCSFMRAVSRETNSPAKIMNQRIEGLVDVDPFPIVDVVSARALASLDKLLGFCAPMLAANPDLVCLFQKGVRYQEEIDQARKDFSFEFDVVSSLVDNESVILRISNIQSL